MIYFQLLDSFIGEVYFRVSKHLHIPISEVMYGFRYHDIDIIMLMRKYGEEIKSEYRQAKKIEQESKKQKLKSRKGRMRY